MYINCGYTDTILIVSKKKYGRDKAVGYISFVVVVVVVVRLWSFGFAVPLFFVSFRERTFALVSTTTTTFTTTRCLERFLSLSLCVCFLRRFLCVFERSSTFCHSFSRLVVLVWGKRRRETHIFHACVGGRHMSSAYFFAISTKSSTHLFGIKSNKLASILPPPSGTFTAFKISVASCSEHVFPFLSIVAVTTFANPVCTDPCGFMSFKNKCHPFKST